ncbi:MAG TPA: HU family DNA-binding protein [Anaerolineales bacterium]|nr:HU family DNA-binding protein [Anaerolineales bacterium]
MSIKFNIVERIRPGDSEAPKKYYPSIQSTGRVSARQLAEHASDISTLSRPDMMAAMEALLTIILQELANGNIVELGDFGHFWLRFSAEGVEDAADVRGEQITTLIPRFIPGRQFKNVLADVKFKKRR